jgi:hypothetical protein
MRRVRSAAAAMKTSGAGDDLGAGGVVLADPGLVVAQLVETADQLEVTLEREGGVLPGGVKGGQEHAEAEGPVHGQPS